MGEIAETEQVLRELHTSESKPGEVTNPQKEILSTSILIQSKSRVTKYFPSLKAKIFFSDSSLYFISTSLLDLLTS